MSKGGEVTVLSPELRTAMRKELQIATEGTSTPTFGEAGISGLNRFGGDIFEEFLPQLRWPRAGKIYKEMSDNDPVIGAILYICEQLVRRASWRVESGGPKPVDEEAREFLDSCMHDLSAGWDDVITEILSMMSYGFSWHEVVYKRRGGDVRDPKKRSKYNDGRIGWRKIAARSQHTLHSWEFDEAGDKDVKAFVQQAPPDYKMVTIPLEKSLLFRTRVAYGNPEGKSLLRSAYRPWYFKKHIEEIEGIGIERDLAGLPVITPPEGVDLWNESDPTMQKQRVAAENLVKNIRRDQNEGVVMPFGWVLTLLTTSSRRQFDTNQIVSRYDHRIAITMLADIIMMGADKVGSFALGEVKKSMLGAALEALLESIELVFNRHAIPRLFKLNSFAGITNYPKLVAGEIHTPNLTELARFIQAISGSKMNLFPDENVEAYLRSIAGMPAKNPHAPEEEDEENDNNIPEDDNNVRTGDDGGDGRALNQNPGAGAFGEESI